MSNGHVTLEQYDHWLKDDSEDDSEAAALVMRQWLEPVEGKDAVIFPPTYREPEDWKRGDEWLGYNIDRLPDGSSVCQIDSVGSQANRMEPIFKRKDCSGLVPQIVVKIGGNDVNLLDVGHRAADASVRFSLLRPELGQAFNALKNGDAQPLAKVAPTSLVFGAWDSRETGVKVPRIVRSVIRAYDVKVIHRSATYFPAVDYVKEKLLEPADSKSEQDSRSREGLNHATPGWTHGGIQVKGETRRDATINLAALRALGVPGKETETLALRRYVLGLALVSFTAPAETSLREGCQLVPDVEHPAEWRIVLHDGNREPLGLAHPDALAYAKLAAAGFGVGPNRSATFNSATAREALGQSKEDRRRSRRTSQPSDGEASS